MLDEIRKIKSGKKELREFGVVIGIFFLVLLGFSYWRHHTLSLNFLGLSVLFLFCAFAAPQLLTLLQKAWMILALLMGWVMSRVILGALFFAAVTPIALLLRLSGKSFMLLHRDRGAKTYWQPRREDPRGRAHCEAQF